VSEILVIAEHRRGELRPVSLELVTAAQSLRNSPEDRVSAAVIADRPALFAPQLRVPGVDTIVTMTIPTADFDPDTAAASVQALIAERRPKAVILANSVDSFGFAAALAAQGGYGFATDVFKIEYQDGALVATRGGYGQKVNVEVDFPGKSTVVLCIRANVFKAPDGQSNPAEVSATAPALAPRSTSKGYVELASGDDVDMSTADFILSIGRGIGEEAKVEQFRELANAVGATLGCSRPIADAGWLPKSRQVGQSGKTASACKLYVAMGISGAIQHLAGMKHVPTIVAVNSDAGASIFSVAKYGIVGDIFEVADELRRHF
jgi:electron transfer flavoprotein alpha subunit